MGARVRGFIVESKLSEQYARCILCSHEVKVMASGVFDVDDWHWHWHGKMVPFSLMVDESTEKKSDVRRGMLVPVRFFDSAINRSVTRLLDLRKVHTCRSAPQLA